LVHTLFISAEENKYASRIRSGILYWHFVDVVWLFCFYLLLRILKSNGKVSRLETYIFYKLPEPRDASTKIILKALMAILNLQTLKQDTAGSLTKPELDDMTHLFSAIKELYRDILKESTAFRTAHTSISPILSQVAALPNTPFFC